MLLMGATGVLGIEILRLLAASRTRCRAATRKPARINSFGSPFVDVVACDIFRGDDVSRAVAGAASVISCVGASLDLRAFRDRSSYDSVDFAANVRLLNAARAAGVTRFVYVSVFSTSELSKTAYVRAHERFATKLADSGLESVVVRPTGFFHSYLEMLRMAKAGRGLVIGSGEARTNPIHEGDVAKHCVAALTATESSIDAGGPEVFTRQRIQEVAFHALDREPRITRLPPGPFRTAARMTGWFQPRLGELLEFGAIASTVDVIAPQRGDRRLEDYFRAAV